MLVVPDRSPKLLSRQLIMSLQPPPTFMAHHHAPYPLDFPRTDHSGILVFHQDREWVPVRDDRAKILFVARQTSWEASDRIGAPPVDVSRHEYLLLLADKLLEL